MLVVKSLELLLLVWWWGEELASFSGSTGPEVFKVGLRSKLGSNGGSGHSSAGVLLKEELAEAPRRLIEAERWRGSEEEKRPSTSIQKRLKLRFCIISTFVLSQQAFVCYSDKMSDDINQIVGEKLDKNNFHAWKFRMTNFLMGKGFWDYVEGENEDPPELPEENATAVVEIKAFKDWNQGARKVMYWLSVSVTDTMIGHIQDAHTPAEAWQNLVQMFQTNTKARKLQLKQELHIVEKKNMSINEYSLKIKGIVESLASINVSVDDDDLVSVCLNGLGKEYKPFKTSIIVRENVPNFRDLVSMLIVEEKTLNEDCSTQDKNNVEQQAFYSNTSRDRGRGRGQGQGGGRFGNQIFGQQQSNDSQQQQSYRGGGRGQSQGRGG